MYVYGGLLRAALHFYVNRAILDGKRPSSLLLLTFSANSDRRPNLFRANAVNRKGHLAEGGIMRVWGIFFSIEQTSNMKGLFLSQISIDRFRVTGTFDRTFIWDSINMFSFYLLYQLQHPKLKEVSQKQYIHQSYTIFVRSYSKNCELKDVLYY